MKKELTRRQAELHKLLIETGLDGKNIAAMMGLTHGTMKKMLNRMQPKLNFMGRVEMMAHENARLRREIIDLRVRHESFGRDSD